VDGGAEDNVTAAKDSEDASNAVTDGPRTEAVRDPISNDAVAASPVETLSEPESVVPAHDGPSQPHASP